MPNKIDPWFPDFQKDIGKTGRVPTVNIPDSYSLLIYPLRNI